jgi:Chlamydia CHLPS protein (DUF818)
MNIQSVTSVPAVHESPFSHEREVFEAEYSPVPDQAPYSYAGKIIYGLGSIITLGLLPLVMYGLSRLLARCILVSQTVSAEEKNNLKEIKKSFIKYEQRNVQEFDLKIFDGASINGIAIFNGREAKHEFIEKRADNQKWIIRFNGRNGFYETNLLRSQSIGKDLDANIMVFNYRGVGESKGILTKPEELIIDGEACIKYLLSKGVKEENILIHGSSLGGGIACQIASMYEKIALINERSFATLSLAAATLANFSFVRNIFLALGWELDSLNSFDKVKAPKLIVFHKQDSIIPYSKSSLYKIYKESIKMQNPSASEQALHKGELKDRLKSEYKPLNIKLQRKFKHVMQEAHLYYLQNDDAYPEIKKFIKNFFAKTV